jgi:ubiquitin C-terminal hydrolase
MNYSRNAKWVKNKILPIGLNNVDLNCYMNSVIQCLFSIIKFREYFINKDFSEKEQPISYELKNIFKKLKSRNGGTSFALIKLKNLMGELDDSFSGSNGADAADLLSYIISSLSAEQTNYIGPDISMMNDLDITDKKSVFNDCKESVGDDTALIHIMNYFNTKYNCFNKIYIKIKRSYENHKTFYSFEKKCFIEFNFDIIMKAQLEIGNCFRYYFNQKNTSEEFCPDCNKYVKCDCITNLYKTSDYLIIILNYKKNNNKINIKYDEYIDLKNFVEEYNETTNIKDYCFRLVSAVFHVGDSSSFGHYISCCRVVNNENDINNMEEIYLFNDSYVAPLSFVQIRKYNCSPYILFYEKYYNYKIKYKIY